MSAKDAGSYSITTLQKIDNQFWVVDTVESPTSFVAKPGSITKSGDLLVEEPQNDKKYNDYTLTFTL